MGLPEQCKSSHDSCRNEKNSNTVALLIAIAAALLLGVVSGYCPEDIRTAVSNCVLIPFRNAFLDLLKSLAGILLFFNIVAGLCGDTDAEPLDKKSRLTVIKFKNGTESSGYRIGYR